MFYRDLNAEYDLLMVGASLHRKIPQKSNECMKKGTATIIFVT
jgi:hypothetical protein